MFSVCSLNYKLVFSIFQSELEGWTINISSFSKIVPKPLVGNKSMVMLALSQGPINDTILFGILACQNSDKLEIMIWTTIHRSIYLLWLQIELSILDKWCDFKIWSFLIFDLQNVKIEFLVIITLSSLESEKEKHLAWELAKF